MTPPHDDAAHPAHAAASTPALLNEAYVAAFNARDLGALEVLYEPPAVLVPVPGSSVTGPARAAASTHLVGMGVSMELIEPTGVVNTGDAGRALTAAYDDSLA